ncbi:GNAT family N-acetyltransferase [Maribellus luteus]|uniref:GNAT family N-acetyltransferase n=1 Tax=Maribellus luteus TaxID=2305463 RepID=A0A399T781_9BACT|nr:GNAT family N-acetyltransferase [Maribellus luteus]RIJ50037.1 GNAT family N-acetyltransferase [Maribellus luteus]
MQLIEVTDKKTRKLFHSIPQQIYKNDPNWPAVPPMMIESIFNPKKNKTFKKGKAIRWVLQADDGKLLGRIAAFINFDLAKTYEQPTGGCGFFECVDNQEAANMLFEAAAEWNKKNGMEAMDGPINFGENYVNWGLLADGFNHQGYGMPYNPSYYEKLFRGFGFDVYFEQYSYHLDYTVPFPERFWKIATWVAQKPQFKFRHFDYSQTDKFVKDFCQVYDAAWSFHEHYKPLNPDDLYDFLNESKAILDPEMIWFAYDKDRPIAMFVMVPDVNQIFMKLGGKMNLWGILKFFYYKRKKVMTRTRILLMGVDPKYQRSGIESGIFWHQEQIMKKKSHQHYTEVELSWAGDFNPKIIAIYEATGAKRAKTHYTMRYMFDRTKEVKKAPIIGA